MMPQPDSHREIESAFQQLKWLTQDTEKDLSEQQQKQELFVFQYQETLRIQSRSLARWEKVGNSGSSFPGNVNCSRKYFVNFKSINQKNTIFFWHF